MASGDFIREFIAQNFIPAPDNELESGDVGATPDVLVGRFVWRFDADDEEAIITPEFIWKSATTSITAVVHGFTETANTNDVRFEIFVEAKTPNSDTLDMETAASWSTANGGTLTLSGTAGDPLSVSIALTNNDSLANGDIVRLGLRRDANHATLDDATGDFMFTTMVIQET